MRTRVATSVESRTLRVVSLHHGDPSGCDSNVYLKVGGGMVHLIGHKCVNLLEIVYLKCVQIQPFYDKILALHSGTMLWSCTTGLSFPVTLHQPGACC